MSMMEVDCGHASVRQVDMTSEPAEYGINDLSRLYRLSLRTIRFYEDKALLRPRRDGPKRVFSEADRRRLEIILLAKRLGFSLSAIRDLMELRAGEIDRGEGTTPIERLGLSKAQIRDQIDLLTRERARVHAAIEELQATALRLGAGPPDERPG